jgi:hypothetical protein
MTTNSRIKQEVAKANREASAIERRFAALRLGNRPVVNRSAVRPARQVQDNTNVPLQMAYTKRQSASSQGVRVKFSDMMDVITVGPGDPIGSMRQYPLNPLLMSGRLKRYAALYGKYKFHAVRLSVGVNMPTTVSGNYTMGYVNNPDQAFPVSGRDAAEAVYAMPGSINKPWWMRGDMDARIVDKAKWYNIDADSNETMNTTQGKFVLCNVSPPTTTAAVNVPLFIDYDIEFKEPALQLPVAAGTPLIWPAGHFDQTAVDAVFTYTVTDGGIPTVPVLNLEQPYYVSPPFLMHLLDSDAGVEIGVILALSATNYVLYENFDDYENTNAFGPPNVPSSQQTRTTVTPN